MNAVVESNSSALALSEDELIDVLSSSLYPGAALGSIKLVINYCKAACLDPLQKPVHIVPMWHKESKSMRDVIMPGIGLYRTQAARSNELAGIGEPEFGPDIEATLSGVVVRFPEWCRVVVRRFMQNGAVAEFVAKEYWVENYATAGKESEAPNAMWKKRPRGQLSKCTQAQALRMAFPEMIGSAPTAEEMEGKHIDAREVDITPRREPKTIDNPLIAGADFTAAMQSIRSGEYDAASMRGFYALTDDQETALADLEKELARA